MLYHWRLGHGKGVRGGMFSVLTDLVRKWIAEDRAEGRAPPALPADLREVVNDTAKALRLGIGVSNSAKALIREVRGGELLRELESYAATDGLEV